jgi:hypothetical protein
MKRLLITVVVTVILLVLGACGHPTEGGIIIRTADPNLSFFVPVAPALPVIAPDPAVVPSEEVGEAEPVPPIAPPCEEIKMNISRDGRKLYHTQDSPQYGQVKIDESKGEGWACTVAEAEAAGWVRAGN